MDEQNKYFEDTKSIIEKNIQIKETKISDDLIKNVKEECILYDSTASFAEENRSENYTDLSDISKQKLSTLLSEISSLSAKEKLLLYFKIPGGITESDPLRQHQNPLGTRLEINRTINWIKSHLEHDPEVSIPKQDVYNDYSVYCKNSNIKPLSTADFGKVMKQVFPDVKPRRLGTRGNSRYCYAAMRKVTKLVPPQTSILDNRNPSSDEFEEIDKESWSAIKKWTEEVMHVSFDSLKELANHIKKNNLNAVNPSKIILQRKYMQRYNNKKKFTDMNIKRKKKRKRKNSSNTDNIVPVCISPIALKMEEYSDSNNSFNSSAAVLTPMNLAMESSDFQKSNHSDIFRDAEMNSCVEKNSLKSISMPCNSLPSAAVDINEIFSSSKIKEIRNEEIPIVQHSAVDLLSEKNPSSISNQTLLQRTDDNSLMGPPQVQPNSELYATNLSHRKRLILETMNRNLSKNSNSSNVNDTETVSDDKDLLLQNLLPRERVISICNMDKHELDDYLPNIENPEEPEAELLQYFQPPDSSIPKTTEENIQIAETKSEILTSVTLPTMFGDDSLSHSKTLSQSFASNKIINQPKKDLELKSNVYATQNFGLNRGIDSVNDTYFAQSVEQKNFKFTASNYSTNASRSRFNFVPISSKETPNPTASTRTNMNMNPNYSDYNIKMYNPTISASAPTSPNILKQNNIPSYPFEYVEKYENNPTQSFNDPTKLNNNDNLEFRSRSVPLNGPKLEDFDSSSEFISECNSIVQTPIPQEFNDFNDHISINGPNSLDAINSLRTSQQNSYIPQFNNDPQNMSKKMYDHLAQKIAIIKSTITRSNPTTPLPTLTLQQQKITPSSIMNSFDINSLKQNSKMFEYPKSMPTTPIESQMNSFRYSPEFNKNNSLIGAGSGISRFEMKKRRHMPTFAQYPKDSNHSSARINHSTNLDLSLNSYEADQATDILKNL